MTTIEQMKETKELIATVNWDKYLKKMIPMIQKVYKEKTKQEMNKIIQDLKLPLQYHMFITGKFSALMSLHFRK